jgi:1,4-alpha-glucan branching enzyme
VILNFTPVTRAAYRLGLPFPGRWREILNSDAVLYGGSGCGNADGIHATAEEQHGYAYSADVMLPPLSALWFLHESSA